MLEGSVGGEDGVVWLNNRSSDLRSGVHAELELALLAVVDRQTLHEESTETRTRTTAKGVEDKETLETRAVVGNTANLVQDLVDELLADSVVTTSIVVGSILLASDHLVWVEKVLVGTSANLVDNVWLEIAVDGAGHIFAVA